MAVFTSIVLAAVAIGSAVYSAQQQKKAAAATRKGMAAEQRRADISNARERRFAVRNSRVARASIEAQAAGTGLVGSSSASAATSNVTSRTNENLSFLDQNAELSQKASSANMAAARYTSRANTGQAVGSIATSAMGMYGGAKPQGTG